METAKALECDEDEWRCQKQLERIAKAKTQEKSNGGQTSC
jgi:hypothetical protein